MFNLISQDLLFGTSLVVFLLFIAILLLTSVILRIRKIDDLDAKLDEIYSKVKSDINIAVTPNFIDLAPSTEDFIKFAIEIWRLEQRLEGFQSSIPKNKKSGIENSISKFKRYFEKYDIEVVDYTNQKYNDGMNLNVLAIEKDSKVSEPTIKETVEPTVIYRGQVVNKAKVIVHTK